MTVAMLKLEARGVIRLKGPEARSFLQGIVTNDVMKADAETAVYAALLTPQGKFLFDMMIVSDGDDLLLDVEAARKPDLMRRLMMYKLRADVEIIDEPEMAVWVSFEEPDTAGVMFLDPRNAALGWRLISAEKPAAPELSVHDYETKRLTLGVPDGSRDMSPEKYFWLETGAEQQNGVSFTKGCYVGQELTARMKHRTNLKKMLVSVQIEGGAPEVGTMIETAEGKKAGEVRSSCGNHALAYFRLEYRDADLQCAGQKVILG
ncbi:MAG: folate-binding protein YgfZ [Alphaproteobacteria bacterium]|nr:folate-binding protein YgfZ [Alphaproteobacteria bacterium]